MSSSMRDIKRRIRSIRNTQQITRAMEMVSAAKLQRAQSNLLAARPYTDKLEEVMDRLIQTVGEDYTHPLIEEKEEGRIGYVVLVSDRGLCGGYNNNLLRKSLETIIDHGYEDLAVISVGRRAKDYFKRRKYEIFEDYVDLGDIPDYIQARELAREIMRIYNHENFKKIYLGYTKFYSAISHVPTVVPLLPVTPPEGVWQPDLGIEYIYEPGEKELLDTLLPRYVETLVYRAVLEAKSSEHGARMNAMRNATDNAEEMIDSLTLSYNRARQASITKEVSEIVGGAEALK